MSESAWGTSLTGLGRVRASVLRNFRHLIRALNLFLGCTVMITKASP